MTTANQWRIEKMLFDPAKHRVRHLEISLIVVVEAYQSSNILHKMNGSSIDEQADNDCSEDS